MLNIILLTVCAVCAHAATTPTNTDTSATPAPTFKPTILPSTTDSRLIVSMLDPSLKLSAASSLTTREQVPQSVTSFISESKPDMDILKIIFTRDALSGNFVNGGLGVANQSQQLRLDIIQPEFWVMNGNDLYNCSYINLLWNSVSSEYGSLSYASSTLWFVSDTVCAAGGAYTTSSAQTFPLPLPSGIYNGERYDLPYINPIVANGVLLTDNIEFVSSNNLMYVLPNFTFVSVNLSLVSYGGLGLAGNPTGSGFLDDVHKLGLTLSASYSLWYWNYSSTAGVGELLLGVVDTKYLAGAFRSFDMIPHNGPKFSGSRADLINRLKLPIVPVSDMLVENLSNGQTLSIFDGLGTLPVVLDTRSDYSYIPLNVIINLAIQTNALYSEEVNRWIVECDVIRKANAYLNFVVASVDIQIPLNSFVMNAYSAGKQLNFSDGLAACYLAFLPDSQQGFASLGLPFIANVYLAVDNTNNRMAIGNVNKNMSLDIALFTNTAFITASVQSVTTTGLNNSGAESSIQYIISDIPFATPFSLPANLTLTYLQSTVSGDGGESIPARFSGISLSNGELFISNDLGTVTSFPAAGSSGASSSKSKGAAGHLRHRVGASGLVEGSIMAWLGLAMGFVVSVMLL